MTQISSMTGPISSLRAQLRAQADAARKEGRDKASSDGIFFCGFVLLVDEPVYVCFSQPHKRVRCTIMFLVVLSLLGSRREQAKTGITPSWDHVVNQEG